MRAKILFIFTLAVLACVVVSQTTFAYRVPDIDKPHSACPGAECWGACTDAGYELTCTQAASANVIAAECWTCCLFNATQIYQSIVAQTGNVGQYPEQQKASMLTWISANCPQCNLKISIAHKGYEGQDPVNPENVTFGWADQEIARREHVKIWVVSRAKLPLPPRPASKEAGSHELTYLGSANGYAKIHDSDCDIGGTDDDYYRIVSEGNVQYLKDYFAPDAHGYLYGVTSVSGPARCESAPTLTQWGLMILVILVAGSSIFIILKRRRAMRV